MGTQAVLAGQVEAAAKAAGLVVIFERGGAGFLRTPNDAVHDGAGW